MSPAVILDHGRWRMLYRRVLARTGDPRTGSEYDDRSVIAVGDSSDGHRFSGRAAPVLEPGSPQARRGVEDPTVVAHAGEVFVFYTGWSGWAGPTATLLWARGPSLDSLRSQGVALAPAYPDRFVKEAELSPSAGGWSMWCEVDTVDRHERSRIALSRARGLGGPWSPPVTVAEPRPGRWDAVNVSTGPLLAEGERLYMLYNGMARTDDPDFVHAARVGLMELDPGSGQVLARSREPVLVPPTGCRIAFAGSLQGDLLYFTVDDREIWVARLERQALGGVTMLPEG